MEDIEKDCGAGLTQASAGALVELDETEYLLRSTKNAKRLLEALHEAESDCGPGEPMEDLKRFVGLDFPGAGTVQAERVFLL